MQLGLDRKLAHRIAGLSWPVILAMLTQTAVNQVDHILIGLLPTAEASAGQAALGPSLVLLWAIGGFLSTVAVGTQALTARRNGEGKLDRAGQVLTNSLAVSLVAAAVATLAGYLLVPAYFHAIITDQDVLASGIPFAKLRIIGVFSMVVTASYKSFFDGITKTRVHMYAALVMNVANAYFCYGFLFGRLGLPRLGITGAGAAAVISSWIGLFMIAAWSLRGKYVGTYHFYRLRQNLSWPIMREIIRLSLPSGFATLFVMSGFALFYKIVARVGQPEAIYAAATQNVVVILMLVFTTCIAYGTATATLVSESMGKRRPDLAERYAYESVKIGIAVFLVIGGLMALFPEGLLRVYTHDPSVIAVAKPALRMVACAAPVMAMALVFTQALFGAGNSRFVMYVEGALHFFCLVPLAYLLGLRLGFGFLGVWTAAIAYAAILAAVMGWKFHEGKWKTIEI
ncbi:MAG TPA: MATE family efflux transporter [Polyangia bacterium]|jgi:putative MATE family efflux protein